MEEEKERKGEEIMGERTMERSRRGRRKQVTVLLKLDVHGHECICLHAVLVLQISQICHMDNVKQLHSNLASCVKISRLACHAPCFVTANWTAVTAKMNLLPAGVRWSDNQN